MQKLFSFFVVIYILNLSSLFAEAPVTLSVEEAVQYALTNSSKVQSAAIDLEMKRWEKNSSWSSLYPQLSVTGTMSRANEVTDTSSAMAGMLNPLLTAMGQPAIQSPAIEEKDHWTPMATISATLNFNAAIIQSIRASKANYEAGIITYDTSLKETERDIRKMFYSILLMQANLNLQKELLENAKQRYIQASTNYKNGMIPELSALQAQVAYENQKPTVVELEQSIRQQLATFAFLIGMPYSTPISLRGKIAPDFLELNAQDLIYRYAGNRMDIASITKNIEVLKLQLSATKLQTYTPSLSLSYSYSPVVKKIDEQWFDKDNITDSGRFSGSLSMNISNLLPYSNSRQNMNTLQGNIKKLELSLQSARQNAEMEITMLVEKLEKSKVTINALQLNAEMAKKSYNLTMTAYKSGAKELLEVKDAESQLAQAQLGLMNEKFNYISNLLDLEYAINTKLSSN